MGKYKEYPTFDEAPFDLKGIQEIVSKKVLDRGEMVSHTSGEVVDATWWKGGSKSLKDVKPYIKLFKEGQEVLKQLSFAGTLLFTYSMSKVKPHSNTVTIRQKDIIQKHKNLLGGGYYKGICELLDYGVLAKSKEPNVYFINTNMFFNGDRVKWQKLKMQEESE